MTELYTFRIKDGAHAPHPRLPADGDGNCFGRVFPLAYSFGWQHFYCDRPCCDIPLGRDPETGEETGGRYHVKCVDDWTYTKFLYCLDCGRVGVIEKEAKP